VFGPTPPSLCVGSSRSPRTRSGTVHSPPWSQLASPTGTRFPRTWGTARPTSAYYRLYGHLLPNDESEVTARLSAARAKAEAEVAGEGKVRTVRG